MQLKPMNRHLLIQQVEDEAVEGGSHGILLPEEYKPKKQRYASVRLVDFAADCNSIGELIRGNDYIVDSTMIESVLYRGKTYTVILENYVIARSTG
jgi:co-chaperonin GroES (HSP10)